MGRKPKGTPLNVKVCVSINPDLYAAARAAATRQGVAFSAFFSSALQAALDDGGRGRRLQRLERGFDALQTALNALNAEVESLKR